MSGQTARERAIAYKDRFKAGEELTDEERADWQRSLNDWDLDDGG